MASMSKREKSNDRISNLPTNLIGHILSFLSTKDAVRTSVLSTHWNQQWTSITHLDFDDGYPTTIRASFVNFVYRVLLSKVTRLDSFQLKCGRDYGVTHVGSWLSAAMSRHVREIDVTVPKDDICLRRYPWPRLEPDICIFSSATLVVLKLGRGFRIRVPKIISLQNLKILHLNSVDFEEDESLTRLVPSCPILEELKVQGKLNVDVLNISSVVLKRLILNGLYFRWSPDSGRPHSYEVVLNTPSLEYLQHVDGGVPDSYHIKMGTLRRLDRAHLCLHLTFDRYSHKQILARSLTDLAVAISNVQFLYLSEYAFKAFSFPDRVMPNFELPKFPRLTDLKIGSIALAGLSIFTAFLQSSPQLASLSFALEHSDEVWDPPTVVPFCLRFHLKVIQVNRFCGRPMELTLVKYFLEKTGNLKELIIPEVKEKHLEVINKVLMLPKASNSCKIVLT